METYYLIGALILVSLICFYFAVVNLRKPSSNSVSIKKRPKNNLEPPVQENENPYVGLRELALNVTPQELHLTLPEDKLTVYGVVMDLDMGKGFGTFVSYKTGDASFYLSNGGGTIGGQAHENVQDAAKEFVSKAQVFLDKTIKTESNLLPEKNGVKFFLLTNKGKFSVQERLENFEDKSSFLLPLFDAGNKVANEIIKVEPFQL